MKSVHPAFVLALGFLLSASGPTGAQDASFPCSGGPGGNFDWVVPAGQVVTFDTTATALIGGPGGIPTTIQQTFGGRVQVRDLIIEEGGVLRAMGPNPLRICAAGRIEIRGTLDVSGFSKSVSTLNTGNLVEPGAPGGPGGGKGGDANSVTNASTPRGSPGRGPDLSLNGGKGGESGFAPAFLGKDARRPGGGGGGRFAVDQRGLAAGAGFPGHPLSTGATSGLMPASGGDVGSGPFLDGNPKNDFLGVQAILGVKRKVVGLLPGELPGLWAG